MSSSDEPQAVLSVSDMALMLGLSRSRFYQLLQRGVFLPPVRSVDGRPFYTEEMAHKNVDARRRNVGINGEIIMFYTQRRSTTDGNRAIRRKKTELKARGGEARDERLLDDLRALGLEGVTAAQVRSAVSACYPTGISQVEESEVVRQVYRYLKRRNSGDNVR